MPPLARVYVKHKLILLVYKASCPVVSAQGGTATLVPASRWSIKPPVQWCLRKGERRPWFQHLAGL